MAIPFLSDAKFLRLHKLKFHTTGEITTNGGTGTLFDISAIGNNTDLRFLADNGDGDNTSTVYFLLDGSMANTGNPDLYTRFPDYSRLVFGNSSNASSLDLEIYHEPDVSYIKGNHPIYIDSNSNIDINGDGGVDLRHNNSKKFETTTTGVDVTGIINLDNLTINGAQGTDGQVLTSTGSGIAWEDASGGASLSGGEASKVAIWSATDTLTHNDNFHFDTTNVRLGIGTTNPGAKLHIKETTGATSAGYLLQVQSVNGGGDYFNTSGFHRDSSQNMRLSLNRNTQINGNTVLINSSGDSYLVGGDVGIGTYSPGQKLHVNGNVTADRYYGNGNTTYFVDPNNSTTAAVLNGKVGIAVTDFTTTFGSVPDLRVGSISGTGNPGVIDILRKDGTATAGETTGILQFSVDDDNNYCNAQIEVESASTVGGGSSGGGILKFKTTPSSSGGTPMERMRIDSSGDLTVSGGDIILGGTGRIQGIDTVSASTDAASKGYVDGLASNYAAAGDENIIDGALSIWNADGDGDVFTYNDANPVHNGKTLGAVINIKGDGAENGSLVRAGVYTGDHISVSRGYYVGTELNTTTANTTQVINSSGYWSSYPVFPYDSFSKTDISTRTETGFYQDSSPTSGEGWPALGGNTSWAHLISCTHSNDSNYYAMQLSASFYNQNLYYRSTAGSGTTGWSKMWSDQNDGSGSGLDADLLDGQQGSYYANKDHIRSLGTVSLNDGTTTAAIISEIENFGGFDSFTSVFKTNWSYAGNSDLSDAGRLTELAGTSWLTWTDNSSDSTRGNITALVIAPNTGGSANKMFVYNDQGSSYSPGWREIWTSASDGSGSGLDADLLDGQQGSYYATASSLGNYLPLSGGTLSGDLTVNGGNIAVNNNNGGIQFNDVNSYWLRTATNWGIYWDTSNNQLKFNGAGTTRAFIDLDTGRIQGSEHAIFANNVYAGGAQGFVFGSSTSEGEYIKRNGNNIEFVANGGIMFDITASNGVHVRNGSDYYAQISNTGHGRFANDVVAYYNFSDKRLKTNIKPTTGNLDKVLKLNPVEYNWKEGYRKDKKEIGLIAQEVEKIIPEVVRENERLNDDTSYKQVDYEHLVSTLIGAVQEQQKQIDELKSIINGSS